MKLSFPDGSTDAFTANVVAKSMYLQIDDEGHTFQLMDKIIDHKTDGWLYPKKKGSLKPPEEDGSPR
jgi:hypothetical protein